MKTTKGKRRSAADPSSGVRNGKRTSFRDLKAFGLWRNRAEVNDPVQFTAELRARLEQPIDAR